MQHPLDAGHLATKEGSSETLLEPATTTSRRKPRSRGLHHATSGLRRSHPAARILLLLTATVVFLILWTSKPKPEILLGKLTQLAQGWQPPRKPEPCYHGGGSGRPVGPPEAQSPPSLWQITTSFASRHYSPNLWRSYYSRRQGPSPTQHPTSPTLTMPAATPSPAQKQNTGEAAAAATPVDGKAASVPEPLEQHILVLKDRSFLQLLISSSCSPGWGAEPSVARAEPDLAEVPAAATGPRDENAAQSPPGPPTDPAPVVPQAAAHQAAAESRPAALEAAAGAAAPATEPAAPSPAAAVVVAAAAAAAALPAHLEAVRACLPTGLRCRRLYQHSILGVAGSFSRAQLWEVQSCLGEGLLYMEPDGQVLKAEHESFKGWWEAAGPGPDIPGAGGGPARGKRSSWSSAAPPRGHGDGGEAFGAGIGEAGSGFGQAGASHWGAAEGGASGLMTRKRRGGGDGGGTGRGSPASGGAGGGARLGGPLKLRRLRLAAAGGAGADQAVGEVEAGEAAGAGGGSGGGGGMDMGNFSLKPDGGVDSISEQRRAWLLAEVGLAAEEVLRDAVLAASRTTIKYPGGTTWGGTGAALVQVQEGPAPDGDGNEGKRGADGGAAGGGGTDVQPQDEARRFSLFGRQTPDPPNAVQAESLAPDDDQLQLLAKVVDQPVTKAEHLATALWNLDRCDQRAPPLDQLYHYGSPVTPGTGVGVTVYTLDSGIRDTHQEFKSLSSPDQSRATFGHDFINNKEGSAVDCDGHGSHVASTAIGRSVGVAKGASLVAVRILDCDGSGTISDTISGLDWIAQHAVKPAVVIMSLGVPTGTWSQSLSQAVQSLVLDKGISVVVASGNNKADSCGVVPANVPETITVAASNMENKFTGPGAKGSDTLYRWSNTGSCVDVFAPGVEIFGACGGAGRCKQLSDTAYTWASGTSMAVPHVAGLAAIYLSRHPTSTPKEVEAAVSQPP